jgi:hypothetical protein
MLTLLQRACAEVLGHVLDTEVMLNVLLTVGATLVVCVYYCRTYYKAVCGGGRGTVKDMCYEVRRADACVD